MNIRMTVISAATISALFLTGCCGKRFFDERFDVGTPREKLTVVKAPGKVVLDGILEENEWKGAVVYPINRISQYHAPQGNPPKVMANRNIDPYQQGTVRLMYDDEYFYVGADLEDHDIVQYGTENQTHFYGTGDTLEIFLKPENSHSYWECYGTPNAKKTSLFFESRGYPVNKEKDVLMPGLENAVKVHGTVNNYKDKDKGWTIEIKFPRKELAKAGCEFKPGEPWTILIARYNYTYGSKEGNIQFSTAPELPAVNYHHLEYYAEIDWK